MLRITTSSLLACLLTTTAVAQGKSYYIPNNQPTNGRCNVIPFGNGKTTTDVFSNQKYQTIVTAAQLGNASTIEICDLAFSSCSAGTQHFDTLEIVIAQTSASSLSSTFSTNLAANVQTVLSTSDHDWPIAKGFWTRIGLDRNYRYDASKGKNLVVQITVTGARGLATHTGGHRASSTQERVYAFGWNNAPPAAGNKDTAALYLEVVSGRHDLTIFGRGCQGSNGKFPRLTLSGSAIIGSGAVTINVENCKANAASLHVIGFVRYPRRVSLWFLGARPCYLYQTTDIILPFRADGTGKYSFGPLKIPNDPALKCARVFTQAFPEDATANGWGRTASNYGRMLFGSF